MAEVGSELPAAFGKYFLTEKLATGGMAEIYLAKLIGPGGFEKPLVIKQIHPRLSGQRHFVDLFVAEAKTLVTLVHGNIVPVYELGVVDDTYYIAMEYIDGPTLYRLTEALSRRDAVMDPAVAAWITARVLDGLDYAHRKGDGVIHRDLSPRNVMLSRDGEVKLVDFGIAVARGEAEGEHDAPPTESFPYMSPEQVRREALTGQTDLFSAGVLAWEMLTGQRLFARSDADATLAAVVGADIARPSSVRPDVPARLDDVVMKALDRDATARWASAGDMLAAINKFLYALDETPGARDVAALVAKYCPPETRRMATHAEAAALADDTPAPPANASGPATAVIPRDGAGPRGKHPRAPTRQQAFATHVDLEGIMDRATPLFGVKAIEAIEQAATQVSAPPSAEPEAEPEPEPEPERSPSQDPDPPMTDFDRYRRAMSGPPGGSMLGLAALVAVGLGAAAIFVFYRGRGAVMQPDAAPRRDAAWYALEPDARGGGAAREPDAARAGAGADAGGSAAIEPPADASAAAVPTDATRPILADAGHVPAHPDGAPAPAPDGAPLLAPDATAGGTATLVVGANPWGKVVVDGKPSGDTPESVTVSAGHHTVQITFSGVDPAQTRTFTVDLLAGESHDLFADFTKP